MPHNLSYDHEAFPVLVLAAGASRRLGRPKALLPMGQGIMLDRAIEQGLQLGTQVKVMTGGGYPLIRFRCRRQPSAWHYVSGWPEGMAASLRSGIESLDPRAKGVFIVLLDQPLIGNDDLAKFASRARQTPEMPLAADIKGRPGAPAFIPRSMWPEVLELVGDRGAAPVLARHQSPTLFMRGVLSDVDTADEWRRVYADYQNWLSTDGG